MINTTNIICYFVFARKYLRQNIYAISALSFFYLIINLSIIIVYNIFYGHNIITKNNVKLAMGKKIIIFLKLQTETHI